MAVDVTNRFNALDINGFHASYFAYVAREKLVLQLEDSPRVFGTTQGTVYSYYELQFNRILGGWIEAEGPGLGEIKHWKAHRESELLAETLQNLEHLTYGDAFAHFELTCDRAKLDVVARDFFLTVVSKGTLTRGGGGDGDGIPSPVPKERKAK